jgi:diketogulonate reductase-like aldo/keto reductase
MSLSIPPIGLGTWQATDPAALEAALTYAIEEAGYRYIDTAQAYENESVIGETLAKIFAKGTIKRSDLFITTKLWATERRPEYVEPACRASLSRLKLDYLDLYLIHVPIAFPHQESGVLFPRDGNGSPILEVVDILDTWTAMETLVDKGLTKHIGVSNFSIEMLERMEFSPRVKIQPYANQVEHSIYNQQVAMVEYLTRRKIYLTSWSSFGSGQTGPFGVPLLQDPVLLEVAAEVKRAPGQVALRYLLQLSPYVNAIPKSVTPARIKENFELDFVLSEEQRARLKARNQAWRIHNGRQFFGCDFYAIGV